jgi:hypothetical protein
MSSLQQEGQYQRTLQCCSTLHYERSKEERLRSGPPGLLLRLIVLQSIFLWRLQQYIRMFSNIKCIAYLFHVGHLRVDFQHLACVVRGCVKLSIGACSNTIVFCVTLKFIAYTVARSSGALRNNAVR